MAEKPKSLSLPLLITRSLVIYPSNQQLIEAGREFSINAINLSRNKTDSLIFITSQVKADSDNPTEADLFHVGTLCRIISCSQRDERLSRWSVPAPQCRNSCVAAVSAYVRPKQAGR